MQKGDISKVFWEDLTAIFKVSGYQLGLVSILIGVLLFLLNTFLWVSLYAGQFSDTLKDKLGMYFYIKDIPGQESQTYTEIIQMQDELKSQWLKTMFSSKEDALGFLEKKMPDVVGNFEKYGIDNPLPATLYVMFKNESQYQHLKSIVLTHKDIILNIKDVDPDKNLQQQENRVLTIINFTNFLQRLSYSIIVFLALTILTFVAFLLRSIFDKFAYDFKVKKILGAATEQITRWFTWLTLGVILGAFVICAALLIITGSLLHIYLEQLFGMSIFDVVGNIGMVSIIYLLQIIIVTLISIFLSYFYVHSLHKKI